MAGKVAHCPACGNRIRVPQSSQLRNDAPAAAGKKGAAAKNQHWSEKSSAATAWISLGIGVGATVLTLLLLATVKTSFIGQVVYVGTGESVNYAELLLFYWGLAIVFEKWRQVKRQKSALMLDVLPTALGHEITPEHVDGFLNYIHGMPNRVRESLMVNRIRKALELFQARRSNSEASAMLSTLSDVDANRMAGSYAIVKVFLWAIPILGFIGTVLGLSLAMASFGGADLTDVNELKGSVTAITSGLATAFNTTLLGLILSMILMFPMSAVQKAEEDCLTDIDAFCNEHLMPRLNDGGGHGTTPNPEALENPASYMEGVVQQMAENQQQFLASLTTTSETLKFLIEGIGQQTIEQQKKVSESLGAASAEVAKRASQSVEQSVQFASKYFAAMEAGITSLNAVLKDLGEKQIVIQQVKRRGLFGKG